MIRGFVSGAYNGRNWDEGFREAFNDMFGDISSEQRWQLCGLVESHVNHRLEAKFSATWVPGESLLLIQPGSSFIDVRIALHDMIDDILSGRDEQFNRMAKQIIETTRAVDTDS